jgi:(S)-2-hydroxyglutarate dehydrogenase
VVSEKIEDIPQLDELLLGGDNNVILYDITEKEAQLIEPRVKILGRSLFSPTTSSVDLSQVIRFLT